MSIDVPVKSLIPSLKYLWREAFGDSDEFIEAFFTNAYDAKRCRTVIENGELCAALYLFDCEYNGNKLAYIYAIATAKKHRGRGMCRKLMDETHAYLEKHGYAGAILVPGSADLFCLYEKMGYSVCSYVNEFSVTAVDTGISITPINTDEYAALRRKYLPENGVIQEGENLAFLSSFAELYAYPDGIMAVYRANDTLHCVELLGDMSHAADITHSLGCSKGIFRTAGQDKPFAMYRSFGEDGTASMYFGLAFD